MLPYIQSCWQMTSNELQNAYICELQNTYICDTIQSTDNIVK
jgi:hypothetical protein